MTTTVVILAALLERIRHLDTFATLGIGSAVVWLKQMIENADEDRNIDPEKRSRVLEIFYGVEHLLESYDLEAASAGCLGNILKRFSQKRRNMGKLYDGISAVIDWSSKENALNILEGSHDKTELVDSEVHSKIEQMVKEIAMRSKGPRLAINSLAGTFLGIPLHEWKQVLTQPRDTSSGSSVHLLDVFDFSCNKLPLRLRPCLLYLGNFPDDAEVETDTICQLWIAEGLISMEDKKNKEKTEMDVAGRYIDELDRRSLVAIEQVVSGRRTFRSCRIHPLIRDFCKKKGREDELFEFIHQRDENQRWSSTIRRAIYLDKYEFPHSHLYGNVEYLRSLLFFGSSQSGNGTIRPREMPNPDQFNRLRVLCLYGIDFKDGKFPRGVEKLRYLRYLSFRECYLEELSSSLSNIFYLETLDLRIRNEYEMTIRSNALDKLKRLKYLYLPETYRTHNDKKLHLGGLEKLEILENFDTSLCKANELLKLTSLKQLAITMEGDFSEIENILGFINSDWNLSCSTSLYIRNFDCHSEKNFSAMENAFKSSAFHTLGVGGYLGKLPKFDSKLPWKLTEIVLNSSQLDEDPMLILQQLPKLRILALEVEAYIGTNMKCSSTGFPQLVYLKLSKLYKLEDWEVEKKAMPQLCTLVIENCKKLHMRPDGLQFTSNLRKLEIASMPDEFVGRIQKSDGAEGDLYKIEHVKVDGQLVILKERQQGIAPSADTSTQEEQKGQNQVSGKLARGVGEEIDIYLS